MRPKGLPSFDHTAPQATNIRPYILTGCHNNLVWATNDRPYVPQVYSLATIHPTGATNDHPYVPKSLPIYSFQTGRVRNLAPHPTRQQERRRKALARKLDTHLRLSIRKFIIYPCLISIDHNR